MDRVHNFGVDIVRFLQTEFRGYDELMMAASHLGDPRNAFLLYFPVAYCLHKPTGIRVLWLASLSEWINALLKWVLHGERPYWWVLDPRTHHRDSIELQQFRLTCETGPGLAYCFSLIAKKLTCDYEEILNKLADYVHQVERVCHLQESGHLCQGSPSGHAMVTSSVVFCLVLSLIENIRPRKVLQYVIWMLFAVLILAVNVSRLFIATHFPHQVVFGTLAGIILTLLVYRVDLQHFKLYHCVIASVAMPTSCIVTFYLLKWCGLDPQWSISLATKYCANPEWIHLDTTLFNAVYRDAGSVLGYGIFQFASLTFLQSSKPSEAPHQNHEKAFEGNKLLKTVFMILPNIVLSLFTCQVGENLKPGLHSAEFYYFITYVKFCILSVLVMLIASLKFCGKSQEVPQKSN